MSEPKAPWISSYGDLPFHLQYSDKSMSGTVLAAAAKDPDFTALSFMGRNIPYKDLARNIDLAARSFYNLGIRPGMRVLVCLPNVPQAVYCLYGLNLIGAVPCMIHPLSAIDEIVFYLNEGSCEMAVTLDQFYGKFLKVMEKRKVKKLVIARISQELPFIKSVAYSLTTEIKFPALRPDGVAITWKRFLKYADRPIEGRYAVEDKDINSEAVVLFSGGTTGTTKGIRLSDRNFNAMALQTAVMSHEDVRHTRMLAAMPVFHGFGLGVCIHTMMISGGTSILVPRFNVKSYAGLIKKERPNFIAGVPTLYEAIVSSNYLDGVDLSCLKGVFSGGDSLSIELKKRFDAFLAAHNASIRVREGYGATECVTACCLTPYDKEKEGSIGIPFPDTYFKICTVGTIDEAAYGTEGEICLTGPSVMLGYINHEDENASTLRLHADGNVWLHTGDLGMMDEEGFVYFRQRIKRMIVTSGYNVYPSQLENIINGHPAVRMSCVIGVPDPYKIQKVKAFVVLNEGVNDTPGLRENLMDYCRERIAKYAMPYEIEVRDELPKTLVGKIAYTKLS
ncbi:MAG: AMP-binding protein [Bacteroidales bacterium]|nr:AMP-binding protein [Bacteroidales bacterium]